MMYKVLDEDTIKKEIIPHLSGAKRGFETKSNKVEIANAILYKLKTGCQWYMLPVKALFMAMSKYGLQRGLDGSEARHITTSQYYKKLMSQTGVLHEDINLLLLQEQQIRENLAKVKREIKTEELKNSAVNVATFAMDVIGSSLNKSKTKKRKEEIKKLKVENKKLNQNVDALKKQLESSKKEHESIVDKLKKEVKKNT